LSTRFVGGRHPWRWRSNFGGPAVEFEPPLQPCPGTAKDARPIKSTRQSLAQHRKSNPTSQGTAAPV